MASFFPVAAVLAMASCEGPVEEYNHKILTGEVPIIEVDIDSQTRATTSRTDSLYRLLDSMAQEETNTP